MIDIQTALYNILHSRYGRDVRQSIHDGIYQINENANEAVQTAKAMGVGTAVSSSTASSEGYVAGNLYLNSQTWDLWQCVGLNSWVNKGNIKGAQGSKGEDGTSNYIYVRYSEFYDGTNFTNTPTSASKYIGIYNGSSDVAPTVKEAYMWASYVGVSGTSAYVHVRYSEQPDGTDFVSVPTALTKYIGFYAGSSSTAPANKSYYTWSMYVGKDGEGHGDMEERIYSPNATAAGLVGTVDRAIDSTNALNLKKGNGQIVSADTITAKLSVQIPSKSISGDTVTFEDTKIGATDMYLASVYCSDLDRFIKSRSVSGNTLSVTYDDDITGTTCVLQLFGKE